MVWANVRTYTCGLTIPSNRTRFAARLKSSVRRHQTHRPNSDRTVQPELERFVAKRMGATIYEVDSSHVPMLSNPKLVIDVIRTAANA